MVTALAGLVGQSLHSAGGHLLTLFFSECRARIAFLLVLQVGKSSLALLAPGSQSGKPGVEAAVVEPQEDGACCRHPLCLGLDELMQTNTANSSFQGL